MADKRKRYTETFKKDAVRLAETSGKTKAQIARDLGIAEGVLYRWIGKYGQSRKTNLEPISSDEMATEIKRLRRENEILRQERDILKKAISIVSQNRQ